MIRTNLRFFSKNNFKKQLLLRNYWIFRICGLASANTVGANFVFELLTFLAWQLHWDGSLPPALKLNAWQQTTTTLMSVHLRIYVCNICYILTSKHLLQYFRMWTFIWESWMLISIFTSGPKMGLLSSAEKKKNQ